MMCRDEFGMSEYQYYEFLAIDKPLTATEKSAIGQLSSRVKPTANSASFAYSYGDFPGDHVKVLAKYFDMMYYIANWGTQQLAFRFSKTLIDIKKLPRKECDAYLLRLLQGESNLSVKLKQQLSKSIATTPAAIQPRRSIEQIFQAESGAADLARRRQREADDLEKIRQEEAARVKRQQDIKLLAPRESQAWEEVDILINRATAKTYDLAVELIDQLRDLAAERDNLITFQRRLDRIYENYGRRAVLIKRL
jgi:hypothetical protein